MTAAALRRSLAIMTESRALPANDLRPSLRLTRLSGDQEDVRPKFVDGNTSLAFDRETVLSWNAFFGTLKPIPDMRLSGANPFRQGLLPASDVDSPSERFVCHDGHPTNVLVERNRKLVGTISGDGATKILMTEAHRKPAIADRVKAAREEMGWSQPELAERVGMSQQGIAAIESGRSRRPNKLRDLSRVLKRSESWLLGEHDEAPVAPASTPPNASFPPEYRSFPEGRVPLLGQAVGGANGKFVLNGQQVGRVFCPPILEGVEGAYAVYVYGDSMLPKFESGEIAWIHPYMPVRRDNYVVAQIAEGELEAGELSGYIKQFVSLNSRELVLRQLNPPEGDAELMTFEASRVFSVHKIVFSQLV